MNEVRLGLPEVTGEYSLYRIDEKTGVWTPLFRRKNQIVYTWGFIAARCIGLGDADYKVAAAYLEYENVANPIDEVTVPALARDTTLAYYNALADPQDFLRVPLDADPDIDISDGYDDYFEVGVTGNRVTFVAQTTGATGVLGRDFSDSVNSKVFGISLVATPDYGDRSQDVLFCRGYFDVADQTLKVAGQQIGIRWKVSFR